MRSRRFALEEGGPKRLTISWKGNWNNFSVQLDGKSVLTVPTWKELKEGREVQVEPGTLAVRLKRAYFAPELLLSLNGRSLPQSGGDPRRRLAIAYHTIYFVGGLSIGVGLLTEYFAVEVLSEIGFGWSTVVEGLVFAGLALWVQKRQSLVALALAVGLFGVDAVLSLIWIVSRPSVTPPVGPILVKILFLAYMSRGFSAIRDLRLGRRRSTDGSAPTRTGAG